MLLRVLCLLVAASACAAATPTCGSFNASGTRAWLDTQGCKNGTVNSCPGGLTPENGCTDAAYVARALAAGGVIPLDPNDPTREAYQHFNYSGKQYNLELAVDLQAFMTVAGWKSAGMAAASAPAGSIVFTNAFSNHTSAPGLACYSYGGDLFTCHESPLLYGPNCGINAGVFDCCKPDVWTCPGAPSPPPTPPPPAPPVPPPCPNQQCYPDPAAAYVCRRNPQATSAQLQSALDYACSFGTGVDCAPINKGGSCWGVLNTTLEAHADWAFDTYYKVQCPYCIKPVPERCSFVGAAMLVKGPVPCP